MGCDETPREISCDFHGRVGPSRYLLSKESVGDLASLGLAPEQAVGQRFLFNGGPDQDVDGLPSEIMRIGTLERDPSLGVIAKLEGDFFWRPLKG
jgi:hypothetical protein